MKWISVEDKLPPDNRSVLIRQSTGYKENKVTVVGQYVRQYELESSFEDGDWAEYSEEKDEYFCPEGWYEQQINWDDYASIHINEKVTHWMPLPNAPEEAE